MSSDVERSTQKNNRRLRRQRNLVQRDSWGKNRNGPMRDRSKFARKPKYPDHCHDSV